jgi:hypothetical protein
MLNSTWQIFMAEKIILLLGLARLAISNPEVESRQ